MVPCQDLWSAGLCVLDRVDFFSYFFTANIGQVLGHAIAHEVGYLLLPYPLPPTGLMRATWLSKDFQDLARGWFLFTSEQAELMRVVQ
jgi:hypothetical protein